MFALAAWTFATFSLLPFFAAGFASKRGTQLLSAWIILGSLLCLREVVVLPS